MNIKKYMFLTTIASLIFLLDQYIKSIFLNGYGFNGSCISLVLTLNEGVAFSMFAFLGENLKFIQIGLILSIFVYLIFEKEILSKFTIPVALIFGAGISNLCDRFIHGGVVDYVFWHCGFNFAIFNFADVMIDIGVGLILLFSYIEYRQKK